MQPSPEFVIDEKPLPTRTAVTVESARTQTLQLLRRKVGLQRDLKSVSRREQGSRRKFYLSVLQVADALDRILAHVEVAELDEMGRDALESVRLTAQLLESVLAEQEITPLEVLQGQTFDPKIHEAIGREVRPDAGGVVVLEITERGYQWQDQVLRPARVIVAAPS